MFPGNTDGVAVGTSHAFTETNEDDNGETFFLLTIVAVAVAAAAGTYKRDSGNSGKVRGELVREDLGLPLLRNVNPALSTRTLGQPM